MFQHIHLYRQALILYPFCLTLIFYTFGRIHLVHDFFSPKAVIVVSTSLITESQ